MKKRLKDIASIQTGYFAKPETNGDVIYLQSRHFDEAGRLVSIPTQDLRFSSSFQKHLLSNGDILFAAKGPKNFAALFSGLNAPSVASTTFFVIRLHSEVILPAYLTWYLNKPDVKEELQAQAKGTSIVSIAKSALEELWIEIPSLEKQSLVLKINSLRELETNIRQELSRLHSDYTEGLLNQAIKNER